MTVRFVSLHARGKTIELEADGIILAPGFKPNLGLSEALKGTLSFLYALRDRVQTRKMTEAMREAYRAARMA